MQWNLRSFRKQRPYLQSLVDSYHPQVICLQETNLCPHHAASLSTYQQPLRYDRHVRLGGGAAIFVHNTIVHTPIALQSDLEAVATTLVLPSGLITVCSLYIPPSFPHDALLKDLDSLLLQLPAPLILMFDANAHHPLWGSSESDSRGCLLADWIDSQSLILHNTGEPTYLSSQGVFTHIDLTLTSPTIASLFTWKPLPDTYNSDHFPLLLASGDPSFSASCPPRWRLNSANWKKFQNNLFLPSSDSFLSPTHACGLVTSALLSAASTSIPISEVGPKRRSAYWWTASCSIARKKKTRALSRYRNHLGNIDLWIEYKRACASFRKLTLQAQKEQLGFFSQPVYCT